MGNLTSAPSTAMLQPAPYNPRLISDESLDGLGASVESFGDIAGITFNLRSGHLVSGHQRIAAIRSRWGECPIVGRLDVPSDAVAEVERPFIQTPAGRFGVRVVDWDELREKAANVSANNFLISGEFLESAAGILSQLEFLEGFDSLRLDELAAQLPEFKPDLQGTDGQRGLTHKHVCRLALLIEDFFLLEEAIRASSIENRGEAVAAIVKEYLEKRQLHTPSKAHSQA